MDGGDPSQKSSRVAAVGQTTRPKAWQQLWLDKHRETLLARLQSVLMNIVDRLVQKGHVNPALDEAYQFLSATHSLPVEKVRCLLDSLRSRSQEAFLCFLSALSDCGCEDLVPNEDAARELEIDSKSLPRFERCSLELGVPACVVQVRRLLHAHYSEAASEVHMMADVSRSGDGSMRDLNDVFVNIALVSSEDVEKLCSSWTGKDGGVDEVLARASQSNQINLSDLLTADDEGGKDPVRLVAVGAAGSGKSFAFTMKATHDWCGGEFWEKFALLRTIRCCDKSVWKAKSISELFQLEEFGLSSAEEAGVQAFIAQQPERVVLVCDGLDEGSVDEGSFLWRIMVGKNLRGLRVIITSRPCSAVTSLSESGAIHRHVQMTGFSQENVDEFVMKYLGESQGRQMLSQLAEQLSVASLMHTPFFALLVCEQFREVGQLPRRRSDVFSSVTLRLVQRFAKRRGLRGAFKHLEKAPGKLFEHVLEVGKVAFDRLKSKDLSYFELEDEDLSPESIELGFLEHVQARSLSEVDQYGFRHLTIHEYLASLYACSKVVKKAGDVARLAEELGCGPEAGHLNTFWVFVAGLLDSSRHEELFRAIAGVDIELEDVHTSDNTTGSSSVGNAQIELVDGSEGGNEEERQSERRSALRTPRQPLQEYQFLLLLHCYNEATVDSTSKRSACVMSVLKDWTVFDCGHGRKDLLSLHDTRVIARAIARHNDVMEKVDLSLLPLDEAGVQQILPALNTCMLLTDLRLGALVSNYQTPMQIGGVLSRNSKSLEMLTLRMLLVVGGIFDGAEDDPSFDTMQKLKRLELQYVFLTERDRELDSCPRHLPALRECVLTHVQMTDEMFTAVVAPTLQMCSRLQILEVQDLHLTGIRMSAFALMLNSLPHLETVQVKYDSLCGDEDFLQLAPALGCCSQLRHLRLVWCGLTSSLSMALLASVLPCLHHLQELCIDRNEIGDSGFAMLLIGLEECSQLSDLSLAKIGLTSSVSLLEIAHLLGRLVNLVTLDLSGNNCCDVSSAIQLCNAVEQHSSLEALDPPGGMDDDITIWLESCLVERANRGSAGASGDAATAHARAKTPES